MNKFLHIVQHIVNFPFKGWYVLNGIIFGIVFLSFSSLIFTSVIWLLTII